MSNFFLPARLRALVVGSVAAAALVASIVVATSASAATSPSCKGIGFSVLHSDQSGGVILPAGKYTLTSPNLSCQSASSSFTTFLNKYNKAIPGWKGKVIAKGWGTYRKNNSNSQFTVKWSKATAPHLGNCALRALKISLGSPDATAGTTFYPLKFVNKSKTSCTLRGYPGVSAVTSGGDRIGSPALRIQSSYGKVALAAGTEHTASFGIVETGNYPASQCAPVTAAGLRVTPPGQRKSVTLKKTFSTCSSTTTAMNSLRIAPIK